MHLEIITSSDQPVSVGIRQIYIPSCFGETGILQNHRPYMTLLEPGEVDYIDSVNKHHFLFVRDGFLEVKDDRIVIISDSVESEDKLLNAKVEIEKQLIELDKQIKAFQKIEPEMSQQNVLEIPKQLDNALKLQHELQTKARIIEKIEKNKK